MRYEAKRYDPHRALGGENDGEDDLDLLQEIIGGVGVAVRKRGKHRQ